MESHRRRNKGLDQALWTPEIHHGGELLDLGYGHKIYSGGSVVWVDNLNRDYMSKFGFDDFAKALGYREPLEYYYRVPVELLSICDPFIEAVEEPDDKLVDSDYEQSEKENSVNNHDQEPQPDGYNEDEPRDQPSSTSAPRGQPNSGNKTTQPSYSMPMESQPISSMTIKTTKKYRLK
ncbi:hypothetical protein ACFX15_002444 [Malus domestica]